MTLRNRADRPRNAPPLEERRESSYRVRVGGFRGVSRSTRRVGKRRGEGAGSSAPTLSSRSMDAVNAAQKSRCTAGSAKSEGRNPSNTTVLSTGRTWTLASATVAKVAARRRATAASAGGGARETRGGGRHRAASATGGGDRGGGVGAAASGSRTGEKELLLLGTVPP